MKFDRTIAAAGAFIAGGLDGWIAICLFIVILIVSAAGDDLQEKRSKK